jgi:predicted membrane-bound mannosyltransferase/DNA-binding beta-propeller fold protein YncE
MNNVKTVDRTSWLDRPVSAALRLDWERALYLIIFVLAVLSRFWDLGARALSHDESLHAYYSWELYRGLSFKHTPLMHGPLRFHLNALFYALFGVDDFTVRIPAAISGVALVMAPFLLRRWLGRRGALLTSALFLISPMLLYHARYIRDEPFMALYAILMLWAMLSYFRDRAFKWLYVLAALTALMYVTMESAFIYVAVFGVFVVGVAVYEVARDAGWGRAGVGGSLLGVGAALVVFAVGLPIGARLLDLIRPVPAPDTGVITALQMLPSLALSLLVGLLIAGGAYFVLRRLMPESARRSAGFSLAVILGGLSLFMLSAAALSVLNFGAQYQRVGDNFQVIPNAASTVWGFINGTGTEVYVDPIFFTGGNFPVDPANTVNALRLFFLFACFGGLGMGMGLWWSVRRWLIAVGIFGGVSVALFTTLLTEGNGLWTGFVGSLGYWLAQQGVSRGSQPDGYHLLIGLVYEYLPILLAIVALIYYGARLALRRAVTLHVEQADASDRLAVPLLMTFAVILWLGFTAASEKMPWHMTHLTLPLVLLGGRLLGEWFDRIDWRSWLARREWLAVILIPVAVGGILAVAGGLDQITASPAPASAAPTLGQLGMFGSLLSGLLLGAGALAALAALFRSERAAAIVAPFVLSAPVAALALGQLSLFFRLLLLAAAAAGLAWLLWRRGARVIVHTSALVALTALALLTVRTAWMFSYVNYDYPTEFGVYAHGGPGLKIALGQIERLSERLTGNPREIEVLYDADATWPWLWYLRDFPNKRYVAGAPSRADASLPVMILSVENWGAVDQSVGNLYDSFQFHRIWWPMEDYKRIADITRCPEQITRPDGNVASYAPYDENGDGSIDPAELANGDARCAQRDRDLLRAVWNIFFQRDYALYGDLTGQKMTLQNWPLQDDFRLYVRKDLAAQVWDQAVGSVAAGGAPGPSISDPYLSRWQDVAAIKTIGSAGAGQGQFVSPHGLALAPDGSIYVADSGNHRVVKFNRDGQFLLQFGSWSGEPPGNNPLNPDWSPPGGTFTEPWDVAVGPDGSVYVADLWNSRVQKFDPNGKFLKMWGGFGDSGQKASGAEGRFYGPRGIAVGEDGRVYVADTGNKRVQVFDADGKFVAQFGGGGLLDGNLDEPVGVAVTGAGEAVVVDTWNGRIQVFSRDGQALRKWDIAGWFDPAADDLGHSKVGKPYVGVGPDDRVYVSDQAGNRILIFSAAGEYQAAFGQFGSEERGFSAPSGVKVDAQGNVWLVDTGNGRVMVFPPISGDQEP